jgi:TRAP-type C4-dicarboxylate transport system permease small subunit
MNQSPDDARKGGDAPRVPVKIEQALAALAMALICLITFANVVARYLTNYSFAFTEEFSVFLMVAMTFVGASAAFGGDHHIRMTMLVDRLAPPWRRAAELSVSTLGALLFGALGWLGVRLTWDDWQFGTTSPGMGLPQWLYTVWLPILALVIVLRLAGHMMRTARRRA